MATVLSIVGSAIAVYQVADRIGQLLSKAKHLYQAPCELFALNNEISDLTITLQNLEQCLSSSNTASTTIPERRLEHISALIDKAKKELLELEKLIHYRFLKSGTFDGDFKVFRLQRGKARPLVESHQQALRKIRENIVLEVQAIGILLQSRTKLIVDEISLITTHLQADQAAINGLVGKVVRESAIHSTLLNNILSNHVEVQKVLQERTAESQTSLREVMSGPSGVGGLSIRAHLPPYPQSSCSTYCSCYCHSRRSFKSPRVLKAIFGSLFVGYYGNPITLIPSCSTTSCQARVKLKASVHYMFPSWFLNKVLEIIVWSTTFQEPRVSLIMRGLQPNSAFIWQIIWRDEADGIRQSFNCGLARPNDTMCESGISLLKQAVLCGNVKAARALLEASADPHADDTLGGSAYSTAWNMIFQATHDQAVQNELRVLFPRSDDSEDSRQLPRFHKVILGLASISLENELALGGVDINAVDSEGMTALSWATRRNDVWAMKLLLKANADPNICNIYGSTPLSFAARTRNPTSIRLLLNAGANIAQANYQKCTALHFAASWDSRQYDICALIEIIKMLVNEGSDINSRDSVGCSPLAYATAYDNEAIAETLLNFGANFNGLDLEGDTALMNAVLYGSHKVVKILLQRGADYRTTNYAGQTILHYASRPKDLKTLTVLLDAELVGVNPNAICRAGKTAMQLAQEHEPKPDGFLEMFQALLFGLGNRNDYAMRCQNSGVNGAAVATNGVRVADEIDGLKVPGAWPRDDDQEYWWRGSQSECM